ncbi:atrial natriuretic peptide receptor 3-like [Asterias rubens]|uniref:atrial natriuretic peptide receptor 3-like n=1 Tax=Asterias rubens TaxID=7604 RepID=UPI001454EE56|nr:atrial natriuretic peptide receptor 3-like [Asterias rubens]
MEVDLKMLVGTVFLLSLAVGAHLANLCKEPDKSSDFLETGFSISVLLPEYPLPSGNVITPHFPYFAQMVRPAIDIAAKRFPHFLPNHNVTLMYGNTMCDSGVALNVALVDWLDRGANAFIGPACEYTSSQVSRFLGYRNVPMVTGGAMASGFRMDSDHPTITRTQAPYRKMGEFAQDFFVKQNWSRVIMVYRREEDQIRDCWFAMGSIYRVLYEANFHATHMGFDEVVFGSSDYLNLLKEDIAPKARSKLSPLSCPFSPTCHSLP